MAKPTDRTPKLNVDGTNLRRLERFRHSAVKEFDSGAARLLGGRTRVATFAIFPLSAISGAESAKDVPASRRDARTHRHCFNHPLLLDVNDVLLGRDCPQVQNMSQPDSSPTDSRDDSISGQADDLVSEEEAMQLRAEKYNATIVARQDVHPELAKFRIRPDAGFDPFLPGQYVAIGLGYWEPRIADTQAEEVPEKRRRKIVRRAYSISCPMIDSDGRALSVNSIDYLEFYVTLVRRAGSPDEKPPALTPRLFGKSVGDRVVLEKKITGHYTLGAVSPTDTVLMLGTGTGEAPHNAMAAELLSSGHTGKIVIATSLRYRADTGYLDEHRKLMRAYPQFRYLPLTTREPENLDASVDGYVGKQYLQKLWTSGELARLADDDFDPSRTHVFLCGNPAMIGFVPPGQDPPETPGMLPLLKESGFIDDAKASGPGHVRYEKYW